MRRRTPIVAAHALMAATAACVGPVAGDGTAAPEDEESLPSITTSAPTDDRPYDVRLADLEAQVEALKVRIRGSRARIFGCVLLDVTTVSGEPPDLGAANADRTPLAEPTEAPSVGTESEPR